MRTNLFYLLSIVILLLFPDLAEASSQVFSNVNTKATELQNGLKTLGVVIISITLMIVAIMFIMGRFSLGLILKILGGGILFSSAPVIASWMVS
ncbi:TrbC/VirB2 family protein [Aliarcobacter thereius]|uniref:TrbC/VirB2 family protein n=1 Tax=Aliarcobacter thereius TaxID=544718 RepID=A0A5R9H1P0_9BACT|nr:TrbC/VirB2 family protein [Aliarcobacter thereius]TLS71050.1 TrbC/VirB2 family protein [Aliarcobacter thereius]TLT06654.1 TrbC/VirB2 family protein [Aliarcobacter thereius]